MKKTLTAIALFAALATGSTAVEARMYAEAQMVPPGGSTLPPHAAHNEGLQNYYYYFGAPCCARPMAAPCGVAAAPAPCGAPANTCCEPCNVPIPYEQVCTTTCNTCG